MTPGVRRVVRTSTDFLLRLAFFALAPRIIVVAAALFPMTGALVAIGLALVVLLFGEAMGGLWSRRPLLAKLLRRPLAFQEYYRLHPPKPFLYYVFYPLLFPYWLWVREARREFWLYRGYTLATGAVLLVSAGWQFFTVWRPELGVRQFLRVLALQLGVETLLVAMLVMPIVTSVVYLHAERGRLRLAVLLVTALGSSGLALQSLETRRDPLVSFATRERVNMRTLANPKASHDALLAALRAGWRALPEKRDDVEEDGKVGGDVLATAQQALTSFYKPDEAFAFDVWLSRTKRHKLLVVYFEARRSKPPIFLALDRQGRETSDPAELPEGALAAMKQVNRGPSP